MAKSRYLFPGDGHISSSPNRKFEELIVFVHFFGGRKVHMRRHVDFVNKLGFDAITFNLSFSEKFWIKRLPISRQNDFGLRYIWGDEIEDVLNAAPGPKIVFAFSNPAAAAIDAIVRRSAKDVRALVTDSGPFVQMIRCSWNLLKYEYGVKNIFARVPALIGLGTFWGLEHSKHLHRDLMALPKDFPVLSIRGWEDQLVPVSAIDEAYAPAVNHLRFETLALPKAGHLTGLKDFPDDYKPRVAKFLERVATPIPV